jgi:hypothetical protein
MPESTPQHRRSFSYLLVIITVVVLPSAVSLGWYQVSKDPNLRPLGITEQALRAHRGDGEGLEIVAVVDWVPPRTGNQTQAQLAIALSRAFRSKGVDVRVVFRKGEDATRVSYIVGKSTLGPFPISQASGGVAAAVQAFNMH